MVVSNERSLIYGIRISSVGPGEVTGSDVVYDPTNMDLAMKLHYLKAVYFFSSQAVQGLRTTMEIKEPMFTLLHYYYMTCGRFRRSNSGRPFIKCNDCGARFIEALCDKTLDELLEMRDWSAHNQLIFSRPIGPELFFSPTIFLQITRFKCGGISLGLSWAHVLGDPYSLSDFMNQLSSLMSGNKPTNSPFNQNPPTQTPKNPLPLDNDPLSLRRVDPVGDHWLVSNTCKMETFSLQLNVTQLIKLQSKVKSQTEIDQVPVFESICALFWHCIAKIRKGSEPKRVTICRNELNNKKTRVVSNNQMISTVEADFSVKNGDPMKLAQLIMSTQVVDESERIEEFVERENGVGDFIVYGANLTFLDLQEADFYGMKLDGKKPESVYFSLEGVGDEGAVLVLPVLTNEANKGSEGTGRLLTVILPENEVLELKAQLKILGLFV